MSDELAGPPEPVREISAMIASLRPNLTQDRFIFCSFANPDLASEYAIDAIGMFVECEGLSLIVPEHVAQSRGLDCSSPMRMITLAVHSALDGVGLTAAVAGELTGLNIACNVVAAYHHDHIFVPAADADRALQALVRLQHRRKA
jgi:hypothetical protein